MLNGQPSPMQDYMATYGQRLQSLLDGGPMPMEQQDSQLAPGTATTFPDQTPVAGAPGTAVPGMPQQAAPSAAGTSFKQKWDDSTEDEKKQFTDDLEAQLAKGNKTIDSAYDDLVSQMGTRPDQGLSRQDKGMLLFEFGLSLMANSSNKAYGNDLGGAIGASGLSTLQNFQQRRFAQQQQYDTRRSAIEAKRAESKSELAKQTVLEARSEARDRRRLDRENQQIQTTITQPDDTVVGVTKGGSVSELALPTGGKVKAKPKPTGGAGKGGRTLEFDRRYQLYLDTFAAGATGAQLEEAKKRALQFAADPKAATLSDAEMRTMAERSADNFQKSNWASFRDMKPDEARAWRDKAAEESYQRLRRGESAALELPPNAAPPPANRPGRGSKPTSQLAAPVRAPKRVNMASEAEAQAAIKRGELQRDDVVVIGKRSFKVQ